MEAISSATTGTQRGDEQDDLATVEATLQDEPAIVANLNPHVEPEQALQRYNDGDDIPTEPATTASSPRDVLFSLDVEFEEESDEPWVAPELLFSLKDDEEEEERATAVAANLPFEDADGTTHEISAVVDSGAAQCAMKEAVCRDKFPLHYRNMKPTRRRFLDASGRLMPAAGRVRFKFWVGNCRLQCNIYIFKNLSTPLLLGTNALLSNALVLNPARRLLYTDPSTPREQHGHIPVTVSAAPTGLHLVQSCEDDGYASDTNTVAVCRCHQPYQLLYDKTAAHIVAQSSAPFGRRSSPVQCRPSHQLLAEIRAGTPQLTAEAADTPEWTTTLTTAREYRRGLKGSAYL